MASLNKVTLIGNVTREIEVKYTQGGTAYATVGLAMNSTWFDKKSQEKKEEVTFADVTVWGKQAEIAAQYLSKGSQVCFEGRLKTDTWEDKQSGQRRSKLTVQASEMILLGGKGGGSRSEPSPQWQNTEPREPSTESRPVPTNFDDVPF